MESELKVKINYLINNLESLKKDASLEQQKIPDWISKEFITFLKHLDTKRIRYLRSHDSYLFESNIDRINREITSLKEDITRLKSFTETVEYCFGELVRLTAEINTLDIDKDKDRKQILQSLGLNTFRSPEITSIIIRDWSIMEDMFEVARTYKEPNYVIKRVLDTLPSFIEISDPWLQLSLCQCLRV